MKIAPALYRNTRNWIRQICAILSGDEW